MRRGCKEACSLVWCAIQPAHHAPAFSDDRVPGGNLNLEGERVRAVLCRRSEEPTDHAQTTNRQVVLLQEGTSARREPIIVRYRNVGAGRDQALWDAISDEPPPDPLVRDPFEHVIKGPRPEDRLPF